MSLRDQQRVRAATSLVFARCVSGNGDIPAEAIHEARRYLESELEATHWLFGYWNAEYLARRGLHANSVNALAFAEADFETGYRCANDQEYLALEPIAADVLSSTGLSDGIVLWSGYAWEKTIIDRRFVELVDQVRACLSSGGVSVDRESPIGGVLIGEDWGDEVILQTFIKEAQCRDDLNFTQQAADINATYQGEFIRANQAELVTISREAAKRIQSAEALLREVGLV